MSTATLHEAALLVELTIRQWTATRHDKAVSREVEDAHHAVHAGRYTKTLVDKKLLEPLAKAAQAIRKWHYAQTLPWSDNGTRLLPSRLLMDYRDRLHKLIVEFDRAAGEFCAEYPNAIQAARTRLGSMFDLSDYPQAATLRQAFGVELDFTPIPSASDVRLKIAGDEQEEIKNSITEAVHARHARALRGCYEQLRTLLLRVKEQCSRDSPVIRTSLMGNLREFLNVISAFNITGDAQLAQIEDDIRRNVLADADTLRASGHARAGIAAATEAILRKMPV